MLALSCVSVLGIEQDETHVVPGDPRRQNTSPATYSVSRQDNPLALRLNAGVRWAVFVGGRKSTSHPNFQDLGLLIGSSISEGEAKECWLSNNLMVYRGHGSLRGFRRRGKRPVSHENRTEQKKANIKREEGRDEEKTRL